MFATGIERIRFAKGLAADARYRTAIMPHDEGAIWNLLERTRRGPDRRPVIVVQPADRGLRFAYAGPRWSLVADHCDGVLHADFADAGTIALNGESIAVRIQHGRLAVVEDRRAA